MKTTLLFLSVFLSASLFGQTHFVGFKGGINFSDYIAEEEFSTDTDPSFYLTKEKRNGFNGGLTYEYHFNKRINCGIDLLYSQRGGTSSTNQFSTANTENVKIDYLSLPIKGGVLFGNLFSVFANVGVIPSFLVSKSVINNDIDIYESLITDTSDFSQFYGINQFDCAALVEVGANYKITSNLFIHTTIGYQRTFTREKKYTGTMYDYINQGIVLHFGIKYALNAE